MIGLIESTVYLSVTALVILLFKRIFKNKLSAKWHVWIWALLAIRLVLPSLPESSFSIFNVVDIPKSPEQTQIQIVETRNFSDRDVDRLVYGETQNVLPQPVENNPVYESETGKITNKTDTTPSFEEKNETNHSLQIEMPQSDTASASDKKNDNINIDTLVTWIYRVGAVLLFAYFAFVYVICIIRIRKNGKKADGETLALLAECKKKTGVSRSVSAVEYGNNPMLLGLVKPSVIIPDGYTEDEKRNIIIHELCHLKGGDIYLLWLAMIVLCLNWFNPVMWVCFFLFRRDIEVYCDERVLKYIDSKKDYAALLVKTALKKNSFIAGTTSLQNGEKEVERRVKYMAYFKKPNVWWTVVIIVIAVVIGVVCLTDPKTDKPEKEEKTKENNYPEVTFDVEECKSFVNIRENGFIAEAIQLKGKEFGYIVYNVQSQSMTDGLNPDYSYYNVLVIRENKLVTVIEEDADTRVYGYDIANTVLEADVNFDGRNDVLVGMPDLGFEEYSIYLQTADGLEYCDTLDKMATIHVNPESKLFTGVYDGKEYKSFGISDGKLKFADYVDEAYTDKIRNNTTELHEYAGVEVYPYLNEFFPHLDGDVIEYTGEFLFDESADFDGKVQVEKIKNTNDGIIYCLNILNPGIEMTDLWKINPDCSKIYLLVTKKEIFLYESYNGRASTSLIMSPDADEFDIPSDFTNDGTTCEYHNYNPNTETGFYETFIFEKGVGLVEYRRGYGAGREHVGLEMKNVSKILQFTGNFLLEDRGDSYYYEVYDNDGNILLSETSENCPEFTHLEGPLYELRFSQGTFAWESVFFNVEWGDKTDTVDRPFYLSNGVIAFLNDLATFDSGYPTKTGELAVIELFDLYDQALIDSIFTGFLKESTSYFIEYIDDTHISVTYYTENGNKENVEVLEIPSLTGALTKDDFKITYKGFTFDFDTTVDEVLEYFPTEEIENISYVSGSPEAKRFCLSYPNAREPDIRIICIQNHETGEQFIETIEFSSQEIATARGVKPKDDINLFVKTNYGNGTSFYTYGVNSGSETYYYGSEGTITFVDDSDNDSLINHISFTYRPDSPESNSIDIYQKSLTGEDVSSLPFDGKINLLYASGAGAWGDYITLNADGSYIRNFHDVNMGQIGKENPNGTVYLDNETGKFDLLKLDDYTYILTVKESTHEYGYSQEWIEDGVKYVSTAPEHSDVGNVYILAFPGTPVGTIPTSVMEWDLEYSRETFLPYHVLYPYGGGIGYFAYESINDETDEEIPKYTMGSDNTANSQPTPAPVSKEEKNKEVAKPIPEVVPEPEPEVSPQPEVVPEPIPEETADPEVVTDEPKTEMPTETVADASGLFNDETNAEEALLEDEIEVETNFW